MVEDLKHNHTMVMPGHCLLQQTNSIAMDGLHYPYASLNVISFMQRNKKERPESLPAFLHYYSSSDFAFFFEAGSFFFGASATAAVAAVAALAFPLPRRVRRALTAAAAFSLRLRFGFV